MREIQGKSILVWVSEGLSYRESTVFLFHKNLWTVGYLLFLVIYLNTISPYCLYFTFLVKTWLGGWSLPFFLLVKKRGCLKILYDLGPNLQKKICPFKTSSAPPCNIHNEWNLMWCVIQVEGKTFLCYWSPQKYPGDLLAGKVIIWRFWTTISLLTLKMKLRYSL